MPMIKKIESGTVFLVTLLLCSAAGVSAQIAGGMNDTTNARMGGNNFVVGTIFWPSGTPVNTKISIRLSTPEFGDVLTTTDDAGKFVFSGVGSGQYTLVIDSEPDFETVRETVDIVRNRATIPETYTMTIRLREKINLKPKTQLPAVVNVSDAAVPKQALKYYERASELSRAADHKGAIEQLRLAVEFYPKFANAWNELGVQYLRAADPVKAEAALRFALEIKPDAYEPLINLGIALFRQNRHAAAEPVLRDALKVSPSSGVSRYYLGRTLNKLSRNDEAEVELLACLKNEPLEFKEAYRLLAVIYLDRGDREHVVEQLEIYLKLAPMAADADELRKVIEQNRTAVRPATVPPKPLF
jgi:Flp pilus assembly protein TadD